MGAALSSPSLAQPAERPACPYAEPEQKSKGCPVDPSKWTAWGAKPLNPANGMPAEPNQSTAPGQERPLSTERVTSSIPQGAGGGRWVYPSEQMFYNALRRKGKAEDVDEAAMPAVIAIHNNMNERAWAHVLEWEAMHCDECEPEKISLLRFVGRPHELSLKARVRTALGLAPMPFDRHDWVIDRCGTEIRYIIDYYDASAKASDDKIPALHDLHSVPSIEMDVRPAGDSPSQLFDRVQASVKHGILATLREAMTPIAVASPVDTISASRPPQSEQSTTETTGSSGQTQPVWATAADVATNEADAVRSSCEEAMRRLSECKDEASCTQAHMALTMCIAEQVCKPEAEAFRRFIGSSDDDAATYAFEKVEECAARWGKRMSEASRT